MKSNTTVQARTHLNRTRGLGGFTILETMIAAVIMGIGAIGLIGALFKTYEMGKVKRVRDQARAVLITYADQFTRLQVTDKDSATGVVSMRKFFSTTTTPTGEGLYLTDGTEGTTSGLTVTLGEAGSSQTSAVVTRSVSDINESTGVLNSDSSNTAAGRMLFATFQISYQVNNSSFTQSVSIARSAK